MSAEELSEAFFAKIAGWEAMKQARALLATDKVLSSNWQPPVLKGVVQDGSTSFRSGLVIKSETNIENLCGCRPSREWGTICAHSVAVGLHFLKEQDRTTDTESGKLSRNSSTAGPTVSRGTPAPRKRLKRDADSGEPLEVFVILPPNL